MAGLGRSAAFAVILPLLYERGLGIRVSGDETLELDDQLSAKQGEQDGGQEEAEILARWDAEVLVEASSQQQSRDQEADPQQKWATRAFQKLLKKGTQKELAMTCEEIQKSMPEVVQSATDLIQPFCEGGACDFAALNIDQVVSAQSRFVALASAADKKKCLPEAMEGVVFEQLLDSISPLLGASEEGDPERGASEEAEPELGASEEADPERGDSEEGDPELGGSEQAGPESKSRMREAYSQMLSFQQGFVSLADIVADRTLLYSQDSCPCDKCTSSGGFSFKCYLTRQNSRKDMPRGVLCEAPKLRRGSFFFRRKYYTTCKVADWEQAVLQQLHVSSVMACASLGMVIGLRNEITPEFRKELFANCMDVEQKEGAWKASIKEKLGKSRPDGVVSTQHKVVLGAVLTFGQVSGMADLRAASRGNYLAPSALLQREAVPVTRAFAAAGEKVGLVGRDEEMYGDRRLQHREEVLQRLRKSWVATVQAAGPVAQGTMSLMLFALESRGKAPEGEVEAKDVLFPRPTFKQVVTGLAIVSAIFVVGTVVVAVLAHFTAIAIMGAFFAGVTGFAGTLLYLVLFLASGGLMGAGIISLTTMIAQRVITAKIRERLCVYFTFFGRCLLP